MENTGIQLSLEEQLENLKKQQEEAERIYKGRMEMGLLSNDSDALKELAQSMMERKMKIDELEFQLSFKEQNIEEYQEKNIQRYDSKENSNEQNAMIEYHKNPVIRWLQKIVAKMEKVSERMEEKRLARENRVMEPKINRTKYEEYQDIIDTDFSSRNQEQKNTQLNVKKSGELTPEQLKQFRKGEQEVIARYDAGLKQRVDSSISKDINLGR